MLKRIGWMFLAGGWLFLAAALAGFSPNDWPSHIAAPLNEQPANWCGWVGAAVAYQGYLMLGPGVWVMMAGLAAYLLATFAGRPVDQFAIRALGVVTMGLATSAFLHLLMPQAGPMPEGSGGLIAIASVDQLFTRFNFVGSMIVLAGCFGVGTLLAVDNVVLAVPRAVLAVSRRIASIPWPRPVLVGMLKGLTLPRFGFGRQVEDEVPAGRRIPMKPAGRGPKPSKAAAVLEADDAEQAVAEFERRMSTLVATPEVEDEEGERPTSNVQPPASNSGGEEEAPASTSDVESSTLDVQSSPSEKKPLDPEALREKIRKLPITFASQLKPKGPPAVPVQDLSGYRFPDMAMLAEPESNFSEQIDRLVREQAMALERSLQTYRIDAEVVDIHSGPVITLYDVQPAPGVKVAQFNNVASDLARELMAQNIRIVPNTAGKSTVGIEVPNPLKEKVRLKELMALGGADLLEKSRLPMFLGKDASGAPLIADLAQMPHMLIAGTTGSGKSVCMNSIIMSFLYTRRPDELKLVLVDPKMVEMSQFKDIPHLMCPVVTDMSKAAAILEWAVAKMGERYELLAEAGVRDIDAYNKLSWEEIKELFKPANEQEEAQIPRKLPRLVFIIDELADLIMTHKEVEGFIVRIAQKARAVGIHLILATQRPQANVVTGLIKANMPCRVAFKVASGMDSRIVLDQKGGELLLGQGDMLFLSPRTSKLMRAQGTLVDDVEVRATVRFLKNVAAPSFEPQLIQLKAPGQGVEDDGQRDPMFEDAVRLVLEAQRGSVSLLQRRLGIGYGRASRIIDEMAMAGILGEHKGSQAREVLFTLEEWEAAKAMQQDAAVEVNGSIPDDPTDEVDDDTAEEQKLAAMAGGDEADDNEPADGYQDYEYTEEEPG